MKKRKNSVGSSLFSMIRSRVLKRKDVVLNRNNSRTPPPRQKKKKNRQTKTSWRSQEKIVQSEINLFFPLQLKYTTSVRSTRQSNVFTLSVRRAGGGGVTKAPPPPHLAKTRTGYSSPQPGPGQGTPIPSQDQDRVPLPGHAMPQTGYGPAVQILRFHAGGLSCSQIHMPVTNNIQLPRSSRSKCGLTF